MATSSDTRRSDKAATQFKELLRELFQFSRADWDFGIYRIMNLKRDELTRFIDEKIVAEVDAALSETGADKLEAGDIETLMKIAKIPLGDDAIENGKLNPQFKNTLAGKQWLIIEKMIGPPPPATATMRSQVFNRLHDFFSRYYDEGDFICQPRYAAKNRYAVPYNGEEVVLHWANKDQYYIKTAERFACHAFNLKGKQVRFVLRDADVEKDNNKAKGKYYIPIAAAFAGDGQGFTLPFEYRALTADEKKELTEQLSKQEKEGKSEQEKITALAVKKLPAAARPFLTNESGGEEKALAWQMKEYIRRSTADFFIHKDLRGFLRQELAYYINSELLIAEEMTPGNSNSEARYRVADAVRRVAGTAIDFLGQLEDFQKALWEKKKFITKTDYCVSLHHLPPDTALLPDIVACQLQWDEWVALNFCDKRDAKASRAKKLEFLQTHPTLVVDTAHFDAAFKEALLAGYDDLEAATDGVLFHSENWQALNLMQEKYRGQVGCVHIDPPYNTETSGFFYKNNYQHSSWVSLMENRIRLSMLLLSSDGVFQCHIDEHESHNLTQLLAHMSDNFVETIIWDKTHPLGGSGKIATQHEYVLVIRKGDKKLIKKRLLANKVIQKGHALVKRRGVSIEQSARDFAAWLKSQKFNDGEEIFSYLDNIGPYQTVHMGAPEQRTDEKFFQPLFHPVTEKPCPVPKSGWSNTPEFMAGLLQNDEIAFGEDETVQPRRKVYLKDSIQTELSTVITNGSKGKPDISNLGLSFPYCHPNNLYERLVFSCSSEKTLSDNFVLDYFAGSGTTAHAVINLNRDDGGQRKFILAEMGEYFNTVLLPRIKKVIFTPEWAAGAPKRPATESEAENAPRLIKYHRIESYDDALENIQFSSPAGGAGELFPGYQARYMLPIESRGSVTLASVDALQSPFDYTLLLAKGGKTIAADLPETFVYLAGMKEKTRRVLYMNGKRRYVVQRGEMNGKDTVVVWRDVADWTDADYGKERVFVAKQKIVDGAQQIFFNDESAVENAQSLVPLFIKRMFGEKRD